MRILKLAITLLLFVCSISWAQEKNIDLPILKTKVKTIAVFKNGLGFVYRSGQTQTKDGWAKMEAIPQAALGTLWFGSKDAQNPVEQVISFKDETFKALPALSFTELLISNVGRTVNLTLYYGDKETKLVSGKILAIPEDTRAQDLGIENTSNNNRYYQPQQQPLMIFIGGSDKTDPNKVIAISPSQIRDLSFSDSDFKTNYNYKYKSPSAKIKLKTNTNNADITMAYLEKGLTWSPGYLLNIQNPKTADITMEAVLANDVEDLDDVEVSFAVGYPNFMFANNISTLYVQQSVNDFIQRLSSAGGMGGAYGSGGSSMMTQSIAYNSGRYDGDSFTPSNSYTPQNMGGESNEDLYLYKQQHVTLSKGSRARFTVFTDKAPYEHIYKLEIPDTSRNHSNSDQKKEIQVWHCLKLTNSTSQPWTTGPCMVVNGSTPIAQGVLNYTPPGGKNTVDLTVATDIKPDQEQVELSRKNVTVRWSSLTEVEVLGKIKVTNNKSKAVKMNVIKTVMGIVSTADSDGKITKQIVDLNAYNPNSKIEWEFELGAGETQELNFKYKTIL